MRYSCHDDGSPVTVGADGVDTYNKHTRGHYRATADAQTRDGSPQINVPPPPDPGLIRDVFCPSWWNQVKFTWWGSKRLKHQRLFGETRTGVPEATGPSRRDYFLCVSLRRRRRSWTHGWEDGNINSCFLFHVWLKCSLFVLKNRNFTQKGRVSST